MEEIKEEEDIASVRARDGENGGDEELGKHEMLLREMYTGQTGCELARTG